jgi:hypothetical protein
VKGPWGGEWVGGGKSTARVRFVGRCALGPCTPTDRPTRGFFGPATRRTPSFFPDETLAASSPPSSSTAATAAAAAATAAVVTAAVATAAVATAAVATRNPPPPPASAPAPLTERTGASGESSALGVALSSSRAASRAD